MVIGGYAVAYHGYVRYTGDLDVFVEMSETNATKLVPALLSVPLGPGEAPGIPLLRPPQGVAVTRTTTSAARRHFAGFRPSAAGEEAQSEGGAAETIRFIKATR